MGEKLRGKVLDLTSPGWRQRPLMASVLAHQERIRNDPKIQAIREKVDQESLRFMRIVSMGLLLLPVAGWLVYALVTGTPWTFAFNDVGARLYAAWAVGVFVMHWFVTPDTRLVVG